MEITYRGTPPSEVTWIGCCNHCKSTAKAIESELTIRFRKNMAEWYEAIEKCPVCGTKNMVFRKETEPRYRPTSGEWL